MKSLRVRLILLFVTVTTATLGAFGLYGQLRLSSELESRFAQIQTSTMERLKNNLQSPVWTFDEPTVESIIDSEMRLPEVHAVHVFEENGRLLKGKLRSPDGKLVLSTEPKSVTGILLSATIEIPERARADAHVSGNGRVSVHFTRDHIDATLRREILQRVIEILAVNLLLVFLLAISVRLFFSPLGQLRDGLLSLSLRDNEKAEELPDAKFSEFSEVIRGFNLTQRKLQQVIERRAQAEGEALKALAQLQATQQELVKSEKLAALGRMVKGIAHELNTPIGNAVLAVSSLEQQTSQFQGMIDAGNLKRSMLDDYLQTVIEMSDLAHRNLNRSAALVSRFKQLAADKSDAQRHKFRLREIVDDAAALLRPLLKDSTHQILVNVPDELQLDSYPFALDQVLKNILQNAITHGLEGHDNGEIRLEALSLDTDWLELRIADNGKGISEELLPRIFDPFATTRSNKSGAGLGLNAAHNIVENILGGKIAVESRLGEGAIFILTLPVTAPADSVGT